jgi:hypothetical protein
VWRRRHPQRSDLGLPWAICGASSLLAGAIATCSPFGLGRSPCIPPLGCEGDALTIACGRVGLSRFSDLLVGTVEDQQGLVEDAGMA